MIEASNNFNPFAFRYNKTKYLIITVVFLLSTSVYFTSNVAFLAVAFLIFRDDVFEEKDQFH